jgi:glycosyltransferase involved in cell wall biosynthesis
MQDSILVSIIVNCFNGDKYLESALNSVINQTHRNWELIFWDNKSTDSSKKIFDGYSDDRMKYYFATKHTDLGSARLNAIGKSSGKYICFLDCDDMFEPDKLQVQLSTITKGDYFMCYGGSYIINEDGAIIRKFIPNYPNGYIFPLLLKRYEIMMPTVMVKREVFSKWSFDDLLSYSPDYDLFMQVASEEKICSVKKTICSYRLVENSLSSKSLSVVSKEKSHTLVKILNHNPGLFTIYRKQFYCAFDKAKYYESIYCISVDNYQSALAYLSNIRFKKWQYFSLYILVRLNMPSSSILKLIKFLTYR